MRVDLIGDPFGWRLEQAPARVAAAAENGDAAFVMLMLRGSVGVARERTAFASSRLSPVMVTGVP